MPLGLVSSLPFDSPGATLFWATPVRVSFPPSRCTAPNDCLTIRVPRWASIAVQSVIILRMTSQPTSNSSAGVSLSPSGPGCSAVATPDISGNLARSPCASGTRRIKVRNMRGHF
ncbi:hypothetical protein BJX65DRAFT_159231 [Aspergillus insuetus]